MTRQRTRPPRADPNERAGNPAGLTGGEGPPATRRADLACVVISLDAPVMLRGAVESLVNQCTAAQIVVVNSGGGDPWALLREYEDRVRVIHHGGRLTPGAARNLGIAATSAPYIAFLACDCIAQPGWVRRRLRAHRDHDAVSSAVCNDSPFNLAALASYVLLFPRRMPQTRDEHWLHYGVSYARTLFERYGPFREDLAGGEDSEFHCRLGEECTIHRGRGIYTRHRQPRTVRAFLRDQHNRGAKAGKAFRCIGQESLSRRLWYLAIWRVPVSFWLFMRAANARERALAALALPLLLPGAVAYSLGAARSQQVADGAQIRTAPPVPPPLVLLQVRNGLRFLPGYLDNLAGKVSGVVALDDGSTDGTREMLRSSALVARLITNPVSDQHQWDEVDNRRRLVAAAADLGAHWVIALDVDERLGDDFTRRFAATVDHADREGIHAYYVWLRELWDEPRRYRVDGIWGSKRVARLFRVEPGRQYDERPFHAHWAPLDARRSGTFVQADLEIYHLSMISHASRLRRRRKYERLDPYRQWQSIGYEYLTDKRGCVCRSIPAASRYSPPAIACEIDSTPPRLYALLAFHDEARFLPGYLENVAPQVDGIIALDDGSTDGSGRIVCDHPAVIELLHNAPRTPHAWNESANQRRLIEAASRHDADWLVVVDADERLEKHFRDRADAVIRLAESRGVKALSVKFRELWGSRHTYRSDGLWGSKRKASLFKLREDHEFDPRPMHNHWAPINSRVNGQYVEADLEIYHLRMIDPEDRYRRLARYKSMDPDNRWQHVGYDYLVDESSLTLSEPPPDRHFIRRGETT